MNSDKYILNKNHVNSSIITRLLNMARGNNQYNTNQDIFNRDISNLNTPKQNILNQDITNQNMPNQNTLNQDVTDSEIPSKILNPDWDLAELDEFIKNNL